MPREDVKKEYLFLSVFRIAIITIIVANVLYFLRGLNFPKSPFFAILFIFLISIPMFWSIYKITGRIRLVLILLFSFDIFLYTAIVHYTGGISSDFSLLYILPIFMTGVFLLGYVPLYIAFLSVFSYWGLIVLERNGVLESILPFSSPLAQDIQYIYFKLFFHLLLFILVAVLTTYISERLITRSKFTPVWVQSSLKKVRFDTQSILENIPSGLLALDNNGTVHYINRAARNILGVNDLTPRDINSILPQLGGNFSGIIKEGRAEKRREIEINTAEGERKLIGLSRQNLVDKDGKKRGVVIIFQDLTDIKELENEIRRLDRMAAIGEFSAHLAHEIRNPLTAIRGSIEVLKETELREDTRDLMELILRESGRLNKIVSDFLEYAKIPRPTLEKVDIVGVIEKSLSLAMGRTREEPQGLSIKKDYRKTPLYLNVDENQMMEVFENLITNAIYAIEGKGGGEIKLSVILSGDEFTDIEGKTHTVPQGKVALRVEDTGMGIPEENLSKVFEPFFTTRKEGTGLGLSVIQKIVTNHGGEVRVESQEGGGTVFTVYLNMEGIENG